MEKLLLLLSLLLTVKQSSATGNSGLNNELMGIYAILIGICATIIFARNGYIWLKNKKNPIEINQEVTEEL